jgi:hypothetical protein
MPNFELIQYDKIHYYKNVIKNPNELINLIEETDINLNNSTSITKWTKWGNTDNFGRIKAILPKIKYETDPLLLSISNDISKALLDTIDDYTNTYNINLDKENMYGKNNSQKCLTLNKYFVNSSLTGHVDSFGDANSSAVSSVGYLNDNYEGGSIYFKNQDIEIKPEPGSIVVFPSTEPYYHESKKIISGTKYMILQFWVKQ